MAQRSPAARKQAERFPTPAKMALTLHVNGVERTLSVAPWTTLLDALRLHLDLTGAATAARYRSPTRCGPARSIYRATGKRIRDLPITIDKLIRE
jgi:hypothetical protein